MVRTIEADWYAYPQYYDIAFRSGTKEEADFVEAVCRKHCTKPVQRLLEPACGTGRMVVALAARGYQMVGFDLSRQSLSYLHRRLRRRGLQASVFQADMKNFQLDEPVDAAFNLCNTFRHLLTLDDARSHLKQVANALQTGGIYIIGLHLVPGDDDYEGYERWTERFRGTAVTVTMREISRDAAARIEVLRTTLTVRSPRRQFRIRSDVPLHIYTGGEFQELIASVPEFEPCAMYDFCYDADEPLELTPETIDAVFVLRKRS